MTNKVTTIAHFFLQIKNSVKSTIFLHHFYLINLLLNWLQFTQQSIKLFYRKYLLTFNYIHTLITLYFTGLICLNLCIVFYFWSQYFSQCFCKRKNMSFKQILNVSIRKALDQKKNYHLFIVKQYHLVPYCHHFDTHLHDI